MTRMRDDEGWATDESNEDGGSRRIQEPTEEAELIVRVCGGL